MDLLRHTIDANRALIRQHQPDQHLHERGLSCSVLAEYPMYSAASKSEVNSVTRRDGTKPFRDTAYVHRRCGLH